MDIRIQCMLLAVVVGFVLDMIFGDPYNFPHIIRAMGKTIAFLERKLLRNMQSARVQRLKGFILVLIMINMYGILPIIILELVYSWNCYVGFVIEAFICYQMLAAKSLKAESMKVYHSVAEKDIVKSRYNISMIVGRDTENLDFIGITKAAVETVAENTSDGVIAPLIYMIIGGGGLGMMYKAINTMDSMIGYKNDKYINFGYCGAKLDDVVNYIPSRVAAFLMIAASLILGYDYRNAFAIFKRDRYNHKSPNSAQTESVCAGALRIQLAGNASYFGKIYEKPYIGDPTEEIKADHIKDANRLMYGTSFVCLSIGLLLRIVLGIVFGIVF